MNFTVFYFSATGNTKLVCQNLVKSLEDRGHNVKILRIENVDIITAGKYISESDMIGIAHPILGGGTPGNVLRFIKQLPETENKKIFILKTAADFVTFNHASSFRVIRILKKKGFDIFYDRIIAMGSNWLIEYEHSFVKQLYSVVPGKTAHMAEDLTGGERRLYAPGLWLSILCVILNFFEEQFGARLFGLTLHAGADCTGCNLCLENCPAGNISKGKKIKFGINCMMCMRCVYSCPKNAIASRGMGFCILKNGYNVKKIINRDYKDEDIIKADSKNSLNHFYEYLNDESR